MTIRNGQAEAGGGVHNSGHLIITNTTISGNTSVSAQVCCSLGGGIYNDGVLTINNSTISGNEAGCGLVGCYAEGGGIYNYGYDVTYGTVVINNSTIAGNVARAPRGGQGGGIYKNGVALISNSTLSGNSAGGYGGIYGLAWFQNSIVAGNYGYPVRNCSRAQNSYGYNMSDDGSCSFSGPGDMNNTNPMLGTLGNYGGLTQTIPLLPGSPAIDAGNPSGCRDSKGNLLKTDQRGYPRPNTEDIVDKRGCDMGAYERQGKD